MIVDIVAKDPEKYAGYIENVRPVIERYGGRYLARGGEVVPLSGGWNPERIILIEFESLDRARECLGSPEYREIAPLREESTVSQAIIVEGIVS